jgi:hypothetical protein
MNHHADSVALAFWLVCCVVQAIRAICHHSRVQHCKIHFKCQVGNNNSGNRCWVNISGKQHMTSAMATDRATVASGERGGSTVGQLARASSRLTMLVLYLLRLLLFCFC